MTRRSFLIFVLILTAIILFFSSAFILPLVYIYNKNLLATVGLLLASALAGALTIAVMLNYLSPTVNRGVTLLRHYNRLENLTHPLLARLSIEAPGSYHHSINVANLSQKAAKCLGADGNLTRLASYYHDIGKIVHPEVYIENQGETKKQFKKQSEIKRTAKIIISHPKQGVKIAEKFHLPEEIINIIAEHHGTTLARFLYDDAKHFGQPDKNDFRYPGPKPETPESAIVMLADCLEAATRGEKFANRASLAKIVDNVIENKISERQLHNLNFSDLELQKIRNSFIDTLSIIYHQRINVTKDG